jgi:hypothetical protein
MRAQEIVDVVGTVVEDQETALALPNGTTALAIKEIVAAELNDHPAYRVNWRQFEANPQQQKPVLVGVLQVVLSADARLAQRLDALLIRYRQSQNVTTVIKAEGAYVGGDVTVTNGDFVGRDKTIVHHNAGADPVAIARAFATLYDRVAEQPRLSPQTKADVKDDLRDVEQELKKGDDADESFIRRRLRNVRRMAPDILEVVLATFVNPLLGLGVMAKKIAKKMRDEAAPGATASDS